jgi:acetyl esterase/lipase
VALVKDLIAAGYAVVQPDYVGLGTPGAHPYMNTPSEGKAVLDALVAARDIGELEIQQDRAALWGYSQGGHAVLAAAQMREEVTALGIVAVVDAAGPTRGKWLVDGLRPGAGPRYSFTVLAQVSWSNVFGLDLAAVAPQALIDRAPAILDESAELCPNTDRLAAEVPEGQRARAPMNQVPGWAEALAAADIPTVGSPAPVFLQYGTADELVPFEEGLHARNVLCAAGTPVVMNAQEGGTHISAVDPRPPLAWLEDRFDGVPAPTQC